MLYIQSWLLVAALLVGESYQDCPSGCDAITPLWGYAEQGGVDPNDGTLLGVAQQVCPCAGHEQLALTVTYTGVDAVGM